jgi:hypothetical protein
LADSNISIPIIFITEHGDSPARSHQRPRLLGFFLPFSPLFSQAHAVFRNSRLYRATTMPKPRNRFPYWDLARELEVAEGISLPEAVQRVVESAIEDAVDSSLEHLEKGFRSVRSAKMTLKELREQFEKHHPRAPPEVLPTVESETTAPFR